MNLRNGHLANNACQGLQDIIADRDGVGIDLVAALGHEQLGHFLGDVHVGLFQGSLLHGATARGPSGADQGLAGATKLYVSASFCTMNPTTAPTLNVSLIMFFPACSRIDCLNAFSARVTVFSVLSALVKNFP